MHPPKMVILTSDTCSPLLLVYNLPLLQPIYLSSAPCKSGLVGFLTSANNLHQPLQEIA